MSHKLQNYPVSNFHQKCVKTISSNNAVRPNVDVAFGQTYHVLNSVPIAHYNSVGITCNYNLKEVSQTHFLAHKKNVVLGSELVD